MRFSFTKEQDAFRQEIRDFFKTQLAEKEFFLHNGALCDVQSQEFSQMMARKGWIGLTWPKKYGGQGRSYVDKAILMEEIMRVQAPIGFHFLADRQIGPALIRSGSNWQRDTFLPKFVKAEDGTRFCLLFSEPNAGSDLVKVATTAKKDGDFFIIRGQKVWTSMGHQADYGWLLARTTVDSSVPRHLSCSEFILDMKLPGITIRPIINMAGDHSFNEVFFDDVILHKKYLVGEENAGFKQLMAQVDYERAGFERLMQNYPVYARLISYVASLDDRSVDPSLYHLMRNAIAQIETEFNIGRLLCYFTAWTIDQGKQPTSEAAMCKVFCTQYEQRLNDVATKILGPISLVQGNNEWTQYSGDFASSYLWGPSYTLQGGSIEILKNIIASRNMSLSKG